MKNTLKIKNTTINTRLRAVRSLLNYCYDKKYMNKTKISLLKTNSLKIPYNDDEIERLLKYPDLDGYNAAQQFTRFRNWVITNYFLSTRKPFKNSDKYKNR